MSDLVVARNCCMARMLPGGVIFFGVRIWLVKVLGPFLINNFRGLGLRIRVRVRVRVHVRVRVGVRVSVVIWSG